MERSTELLFERRKAVELAEEKRDFDYKYNIVYQEYASFKQKASQELKQLREKISRISEENKRYHKTMEEMSLFFHKVNSI